MGSPLPQIPQALDDARKFAELKRHPGWAWFVGLIEKERAEIAARVLTTMPKGEERDAAIERHRTLGEALAKPERVGQGADAVIASEAGTRIEESDILPP